MHYQVTVIFFTCSGALESKGLVVLGEGSEDLVGEGMEAGQVFPFFL